MESEKIPINKKSNLTERLTTYIFYFSVLLFLTAFNFQDKMTGGWYQQSLPNLNGHSITDITFLDSLTGYAVTNGSNSATGYIIKTTNGGDNWNIIYSANKHFKKVVFLNMNTGFVCGGQDALTCYLYKTTDAGQNWFTMNTPFGKYGDDMAVLNEDTILIAESSGFDGGIYKTTDGCQSWVRTFNGGSNNPGIIYMYNKNIGFFSNPSLYKTTNGGNNWFILSGGNFTDMYFSDSLTGWIANMTYIKKTTDGGYNWINQNLPSGGIILDNTILKIKQTNSDTIYGVGGTVFYGSGQFRGMIYRTTNGGNNWMYQVPDTSIHIGQYINVDFVNSKIGWAFDTYDYKGCIHTRTGGDSIYITTEVNSLNTIINNAYVLYQNYPNPFNPVSSIKYQVLRSADIKLIVYNITGKEITTLLNKKQNSGEYSVKFDGSNLSSGVYFYVLFADGNRVDSKKMVILK